MSYILFNKHEIYLCVSIARYQLMLKCWRYRPEERPTFGYCLEVLTELRENTSDAIKIISPNTNRLQNGERNFCLTKFSGSIIYICSCYAVFMLIHQIMLTNIISVSFFLSLLWLHLGGIFNRSYLLSDENHNNKTGGNCL